ncbi:MG2 domain-containing protein [Flavobacteriales bacterium]|nr:MG2 domain-containing protein [Flavobacteriales bacterium]
MKKILFSILAVAFIFACGNNVKTDLSSRQAFSSFISGYTSGYISKASSIKIKLTESVDESVDLTKELDKSIFTFSPDVDGVARWIDNRTIEFIPTNGLKSGQKYVSNFKLSEFKDVPKELEKFVFDFNVINQSYEVSIHGLHTPDESNMAIQDMEGTIHFADIVDSLAISRGLKATQKGTVLPLSISAMPNNQYRFVVGNIKRAKREESEVIIKFDGGAIGVTKDYEEKKTVYSQKSFKISEVSIVQEPQQYILIHFTDPLKSNQNLRGLVTLNNSGSIQTVIDGHDIKVFPGRQLIGDKELTVFAGVQNKEGYKLGTDYSKQLTFEALKPDVRKYGDGVIIPSEGQMNFPFEAVNLKAVDIVLTKIYESNVVQFFQTNSFTGSDELKRVGQKVVTKKLSLQETGVDLNKWNRFTIDLSSVIDKSEGAIYQVHVRFKKEYSNYKCDKEEGDDGLTETETVSEEKEWSEDTWRTYDYDYYDSYSYSRYDYNYSERENPCHSMYYRNKNITQNLILSDIGIIAKAGSNKVLHVITNDINSTKPMSGVSLEIFNYQQQSIGTVTTDGEGMGSIQLDEKPFVIVASAKGQKGFLRLRDGESLSLSKFDVSGSTIQKGIKGFIYTERGVWRPGDSVYLTFMMEDKNSLLPDNHPVEFKLYNPKNQLVTRSVSTKSVNGIYDFRTATGQDALTGNYRAQIKVGNRQFVRYLKIETVKPNRLKVKLETEKKIISSSDDTKLSLNVTWLHGSPASKLKTKVDVSIDQAGTNFDNFKGYQFDDPTKRFNSNDYTVFDSRLDEEGKAEFPLKLTIKNAAPGMLNAHFTTKAFEEGGGFSVNRKSLKYSPYKSYVGVKVPKGDLYAGTLEINKTHKIQIANVTEDGKPISSKLETKIYKVSWRYWWDRYDSDLSSYISRSGVTPIDTQKVSLKKGKGTINFKPETWGRYLIVVKDKASGHSTGQIFFADQRYWSRSNRTDKEFMTMLAFSTDKETYEVGEEVKFSFPSREGGRALVSIENGSKIVEKKWITTSDKETKGSFEVTADMTPNVYVHITMLQPYKNTMDDVPMRMYGIVPITIENKNSHLEPVISMPDVLRPETTATIKVSEKNGKAMSYTLAIVDEGLLDLTSFQTPDPWSTFYAREALGVKSWDMYDYVLNAYKIEQDKILAIGGGGQINPDKKSARANRFKPMVRFIGPFTSNGKSKSHKVDIPNYVGSVRVMVVAGEDLKYGNAEKTVPVRNPLMVLGTLPRVVGPKEDITLPIDVFAMEDHVKNVKLTVTANEFFELDESTKNLTFEKTGDQVVRFKMKAANKLGVGKVSIVATSGKEKATYDFEVDVRPANPPVTSVQEGVIQAGDSWESETAFDGITGTNTVALEVSSFPAINLEQRMRYLIRYPHGCVEQTTSSVFPQLYLSKFSTLGKQREIEIENNIKQGILRLRKFQTANGGFSYWPGDSYANNWGSVYASHFLLEAEKEGYALPFGMKNKMLQHLGSVAKSWRRPSRNDKYYRYQSNELTQSYRLFILAMAGKPEVGAMNRLREFSDLSVTAKWKLAGAYQLIKQTTTAKKLVESSSVVINDYRELSYSYGSAQRDEAIILEVLSLMKDKSRAANLAKKVAQNMGGGTWMSTQTTAYSLIAMSQFIENTSTSGVMKFSYSLNGSSMKNITEVKPMYVDKRTKITTKNGKVTLQNNGDGLLYVRVVKEGIPIESNDLNSESGITMNVNYLDMDGKTINPTSIKQGTDFKMKVTIYNTGSGGYLREMALSQIFPSGWEIHNSRMSNSSTSFNKENSSYDYQDIRDDRVYTYFSLGIGKTKTFVVNLNATYDGKYYLPSILCEAMYDNLISSVKNGKWVEVVRN